jgi:hypothetical protein
MTTVVIASPKGAAIACEGGHCERSEAIACLELGFYPAISS